MRSRCSNTYFKRICSDPEFNRVYDATVKISENCGIHKPENRFSDQRISSVMAIEHTLLKAANGEDYSCEIVLLKESCYKNDIEWSDLSRHLPILQDVIKKKSSRCEKR